MSPSFAAFARVIKVPDTGDKPDKCVNVRAYKLSARHLAMIRGIRENPDGM